MLNKMSRLFGLGRGKQGIRRCGLFRRMKPLRYCPHFQVLERRDLPSTVTFYADHTDISDINNETVRLEVNGDGTTRILIDDVNRGLDTSHRINLTESGGDQSFFSVDDTGGLANASITTDANGHQAVTVGPSSGSNLYTLNNDLFAAKTLDAFVTGPNTVTIANSTNGLALIRDWTVDGGGAADLKLVDYGSVSAATYQVAGNQVSLPDSQGLIVTYSSVTSLTVTGSHVNDTFDVWSTSATTNIVAGAGATVNLGDAGSVQGILGTLNLENPPAFSDITVDDSADATAQTVTVSTLGANPADSEGTSEPWGQISGLAPAPINYEYADTNTVTLNGGSGDNTFTVLATGGPLLTLSPGPGNDTVDIGNGNLSSLSELVTVNGSGGNTTLVVDDSAFAGTDSYGIRAGNITVGRLGNFELAYSGIANLNLLGDAGSSTIDVHNTAPGTAVNVTGGAGLNDIYIGDENLDNLLGPVTVNGGGRNVVVVRDDQAAAGRAYTITSTSVTRDGFGGLTYGNAQALYVYGGAGNFYYVSSTSAPTTLTSGGDNSVFLLGAEGTLNNISGPVTVHGYGAFNAVGLDDHASSFQGSYTITSNMVTRDGFGGVTYDSLQSLDLTGTRAGDVYNVLGTSVSTILYGLAAGDSYNIGNGDLGNLQGHLNVRDFGGSNAMVVDDSGFAGNDTYRIGASDITIGRSSGFDVAYFGITNLTFLGGSGSDHIYIDATSANTVVDGGAGGNIFYVGQATQSLGSLAGALTVNGGGADALVFVDTANLNAETYNFDSVPGQLTLTTVPVSVSFTGMASVYLETNGFSTVNDPSGTVLVDVPPPP
jgi:hypothetical protein